MKKYEFTGETIKSCGKVLHRIRAVRNFNGVKKGQLGGFIEKEENLSHDGDAWVYDNAKVFNNAEVCGNARIYFKGEVSDNARICDNAWINGSVVVYGNVRIGGNARICGNAWIYSNAEIYGK